MVKQLQQQEGKQEELSAALDFMREQQHQSQAAATSHAVSSQTSMMGMLTRFQGAVDDHH